MALPPRAFFTVHETAARWGCTLADISGWSTAGDLDVITGIPPTFCGDARIAGTVVVCTMDILPMFRRTGTGPQNAHLRRVRTENAPDKIKGSTTRFGNLQVIGFSEKDTSALAKLANRTTKLQINIQDGEVMVSAGDSIVYLTPLKWKGAA